MRMSEHNCNKPRRLNTLSTLSSVFALENHHKVSPRPLKSMCRQTDRHTSASLRPNTSGTRTRV